MLTVFIVSAARRRRDIENTVLFVGRYVQKFNIVSNDHGHTQKCDFFVLDWKYPFLGKFGPKIQNCLFKVKYGTLTNSNMQNQMVIFTFFF